jgi:hypothetical protein
MLRELVQRAVEPLVEDERVEPAQQVRVILAKPDMARRESDHELRIECLAGVLLLEILRDRICGGKEIGLPGQIGRGCRRVVVKAQNRGLRCELGQLDVLRRAAGDAYSQPPISPAEATLASAGPKTPMESAA